MVQLWDAGIDYLTMTFAPDHAQYNQAAELIRRECRKSASKEFPLEPFAWNGYVGYKQGKVSTGERADGAIIRVSGLRSRHIGDLLKHHGIKGKATRLDFQTTGQTTIAGTDFLKSLQGTINAATGKDAGSNARNTAIYKIRGSDTGYTIGSRSSESYCRIYDKTAEQHGKVAPNLIRFENELKGRKADYAWKMYLSSANGYWLNCSIVKAEMERYGVNMDWLATGERCEMPSSYEPSNTQKRIGWLKYHVRPTVQRLVGVIGRDAVLEILGLD